MAAFGFGFGGIGQHTTAALMPVIQSHSLEPSAGWTGAAASGFGGNFGTAPVYPVRTAAKPVCRLLVPLRQRFTDNHAHVRQTKTLPDTTLGGAEQTLFADAAAGDFTPAGLLLTNLAVPIVKYDLNRVTRGATDAKGAVVK